MVHEVYRPVTSGEQSLSVAGYPKAVVQTPIVAPTEAGFAAIITVSGTIKNTGYDGDLSVDLYDILGAVAVDTKGFVAVAAGATVSFSLTGVMPNRDWGLRVRGYHLEPDGPIQGFKIIYDSTVDVAITLIYQVYTSLTLLAMPSVKPGLDYTYQGKLLRPDTGTGIVSQAIILERYEGAVWVKVGEVITGTDGAYSKAIVSPITPAVYKCRSRFAGTAGYYRASVSGTRSLTVGEILTEYSYPLAGAVVGGVGTLITTRQPVVAVMGTIAGAIIGEVIGRVATGTLTTPPTVTASKCPVCGIELGVAQLGTDIKCPECNFISTWARR